MIIKTKLSDFFHSKVVKTLSDFGWLGHENDWKNSRTSGISVTFRELLLLIFSYLPLYIYFDIDLSGLQLQISPLQPYLINMYFTDNFKNIDLYIYVKTKSFIPRIALM